MEKFIPYEKLSKKKQREISASRRNSWGALNPVTRKPQNPKAYNRKTAQGRYDDLDLEPCFVLDGMKYDGVLYSSKAAHNTAEYECTHDGVCKREQKENAAQYKSCQRHAVPLAFKTRCTHDYADYGDGKAEQGK